eukprot:COSAG06_NODE_55458_length_289_cov_1.084211_1_plen_24_part_01
MNLQHLSSQRLSDCDARGGLVAGD